MGKLFGFDEETAERVVAAVEQVEGGIPASNYKPERLGKQGRAQAPEVQWVRVLSTSPTNGLYPAKVQQTDVASSPPGHPDLGDCWASDPNGSKLTLAFYLGRRTGPASDGKPIFEVVAPPSAVSKPGWSGCLLVVTNVFCDQATGNVQFSWSILYFENGLLVNVVPGGQCGPIASKPTTPAGQPSPIVPGQTGPTKPYYPGNQ